MYFNINYKEHSMYVVAKKKNIYISMYSCVHNSEQILPSYNKWRKFNQEI